MAEREGAVSAGRAPRMMIAIVILAMVAIGFASLYMVADAGQPFLDACVDVHVLKRS
jgi:hypothetical protein